MKRTIKEKDIQKAILDYLRLTGVFCFKVNTTGIFKQSTGHYIPSPSAGCPDIIVIVRGKFVGIECKTPKGVQSPAQKKFQAEIEDAGGIYLLARSIDDVVNLERRF